MSNDDRNQLEFTASITNSNTNCAAARTPKWLLLSTCPVFYLSTVDLTKSFCWSYQTKDDDIPFMFFRVFDSLCQLTFYLYSINIGIMVIFYKVYILWHFHRIGSPIFDAHKLIDVQCTWGTLTDLKECIHYIVLTSTAKPNLNCHWTINIIKI